MPVDQVLSLFTDRFQNVLVPNVTSMLVTASPVILAGLLLSIFWPLWVRYVRAKYFFSLKYNLLEIRLPKDTFKSPLAMELFLTALHQTGGEGNWYQKFWLGQTRSWFSLEMVSVEGQVKFYIWTRSGSRGFIESSLYAQFPGIEIHERDDYARTVSFVKGQSAIWGCELQFTKKEMGYPIKTYVDYGLDRDPKEEFKVDPLAPLVEYLGSIGPNQQVWMQILVRAHKDEDRKPGHLWKTTDAWKDSAEKIINEILKRDPKTKVAGTKDVVSGRVIPPTISKGEQEIVAAIERGLAKHRFDIGIRCVYITKEGFFSLSNIGAILGSWKQFGSANMNGFRPNSKFWHAKFDYPWQDFGYFLRNRQSRKLLMAYKRRAYFYAPVEHKPIVMNTEELATIFHFPGQVVATPTFERVPSRKAEAPANIPI